MTRLSTMAAIAGLVALTAAILACAALVATADPDTTNPPASDWVFDSGASPSLSTKEWVVGYNISVVNGTSLTILACDLTMVPAYPDAPIWIRAAPGSTLVIDTSTLSSKAGEQHGFYIRVEGNVTIISSTLEGLDPDATVGGGVALYGANAILRLSTVIGATGPAAVYGLSSNLTVAACSFVTIAGDAIRTVAQGTAAGVTLSVSVVDTTFSKVIGAGVSVTARSCHGTVVVDMARDDLGNVTGAGVLLQQGSGATNDGGDGDLLAALDAVAFHDIGGTAVYLASLSQVQRAPGTGTGDLNLTLSGSRISRAVGGGVWLVITDSAATCSLQLESDVIEDIALGVAASGVSGVQVDHTFATTNPRLAPANITVSNCTFRRCAWGGMYEKGNNANLAVFHTTFDANIQFGLHINTLQSGYSTPASVDLCTFTKNDGYGIYVDYGSSPKGSSRVITVARSTFTDNNNTAIGVDVINYVQSNQAVTVGLDISDCVIHGSQAYPAIRIAALKLAGGISVHISSTLIEGTSGVSFAAPSLPGVDSYQAYVTLTDVSILNTTGLSLDVGAAANVGALANVTITNLTAHSLSGDAVSIACNMASERTTTLTSTLVMLGCSLEADNGTGLSVSTNGKHLTGENVLTLTDTFIKGSSRGLVVRGHDGTILNCTIIGTSLDDLLGIDVSIDTRHVALSGPVPDKVHVLTRGEIRLYFSLGVTALWSSGVPADGATVWIRDNSLATVSISKAGDDGASTPVVLNSYIVHPSGAVSRNPYVVNTSFFGVFASEGIILDGDTELTVTLRDNVDPVVFVLSPTDGAVQQSAVITVVGTAWDYESGIAGVRLSVDGVTWTPVHGTSSWNVDYLVSDTVIAQTGGRITLRVEAFDNAGNTATVTVSVRIVNTPPGITVYYPANGTVTNSPTLAVGGVTDEGAVISVNGVEVPVVATAFSATVGLVEGVNTVSIVSSDSLGNTNLVRLQVTLDTRAPFVVLRSPEENATVNVERVRVLASIEGRLLVTVNGQAVPYGSIAYPTGGGVLDVTIPLSPGENSIVVEAVDLAGNALRLERRVFVDTEPPWIVVTQPLSGAMLTRHDVVLLGTVDPTAVLRIDGEVVTTTQGVFSVPILASEGANTVNLWAIDPAGNGRMVNWTFAVDTFAPVLSITGPASGASVQVSAVRFVISGTVLSGGVVTATRLLLDGASSVTVDDGSGGRTVVALAINAADGTFTIPVDLVEGGNVLTVTVLDEAGNPTETTVHITLDTVAPLLTVAVEPSWPGTAAGKVTTWSHTVSIVGSTEPGATLTIDGHPVPVGADGSYSYLLQVPGTAAVSFTVSSRDAAGNLRTVTTSVTYSVPAKQGETKEVSAGLIWGSLVVFIVLLIIAVVFVAMTRRRGGEEEAGSPPEPPEEEEGTGEDEEAEEDEEAGEEGEAGEEEEYEEVEAPATPPTPPARGGAGKDAPPPAKPSGPPAGGTPRPAARGPPSGGGQATKGPAAKGTQKGGGDVKGGAPAKDAKKNEWEEY